MLDSYLQGYKPSFTELESQLSRLIQEGRVYPLMFGSAKLGLGIRELLDAIIRYFPAPGGDPEKPLSGLVYGISHDRVMGKIAHVRLFDGTIGW
jgi:ribosomal protection tetracycline resistance protein